MRSAPDQTEGDRMWERTDDWVEPPPRFNDPPWDWRRVAIGELDPVTARMVGTYRQRAQELGVALERAPDDPFELFAPPHAPYPTR